MPANFKLVSGDTGSKVMYACLNDDDGSVIDLTGKTAKIKWNNVSGVSVEKDATIITVTSGPLFTEYGSIKVIEYQFLAAEIYPGVMNIQIKIINADTSFITCLELDSIKVRLAI